MRACRRFLAGIPHCKVGHPRVTHPSATPWPPERNQDVRLACVRHAASVYPEPGSNSPSKYSMYFNTRLSAAVRCERTCVVSYNQDQSHGSSPRPTPERQGGKERVLVARRLLALIV